MSKTTVLSLGGAVLLLAGCAVDTKAPPQLEEPTLAPELVVVEEAAEPDPTIKGSFVNVKYLVDEPPVTTIGNLGDATWNPETNTVTWYDEVKDGAFQGHRWYSQCVGRIHYEVNNGVPKKDGMVCETNMVDGAPASITVAEPQDGFLSSKTTFQF